MEDMEHYEIGQEVVHPRMSRGMKPGSAGVIIKKYLSGAVVKWDSGPLAGQTIDMSHWEIEKVGSPRALVEED